MLRNLAVAAAAAATLACLPAQAQEIPELEGAPGYRAAEQATADRLRADQARLARQAEAQKAEQARLDRQAEDLKAQQARLDARAAELAAEEKRLVQLRSDQATDDAATLAELARQREDDAQPETQPETETADLSRDDDTVEDAEIPPFRTMPEPRRPTFARLDFGAARRSCTRAAEDEALARNFYSAQYDSAPRFVQNDAWELRGRMRLEDRRGYFLVDTICELDVDGEARDFIFLR